MKRVFGRSVSQVLFLSFLASCGGKDAVTATPVGPGGASAAQQPADAFVASASPAGTPAFVWATAQVKPPAGSTVESAARFHLDRLAHAYKLPAARAAELVYTNASSSGVRVATLRQRVNGVEIFPGQVKLVMRRDLSLVAISGTAHDAAAPRGNFELSPAQALATVLAGHFDTSVADSDLAGGGPGEGGYQRLDLVGTPQARGGVLRLGRPARVKPIYFPLGETLVPAYFVEFLDAGTDLDAGESYRYIVAAEDGRELDRANLVHDVAFTYRVWADTEGDKTPLHGPMADYFPHPNGVPDKTGPAFIPPVLVSMDGMNKNPAGLPDPWLASAAVQTLGNNVDAYADNTLPSGYSNGDVRATTSGMRAFDRVFDTTKQPLASLDQQMAAVTHLFYVNNWLHDYWYDSGFTEAAGNAQVSNYGRGGLGGDVLLAEAQDNFAGGSRNNANMSTPADGASPRMQMFVFNGPESRGLTSGDFAANPTSTPSVFGPRKFDVQAEVVLAVDATAPLGDACTALTNDVAGKIALIDRLPGVGSCTVVVKVKNAQAAGAVGAIVVNTTLTAGGMGGVDPTLTIAAMGVNSVDGAFIKNAVAAGPFTARLQRDALDRDGTIDSMIIGHEWGHYIHNRLVEICSTNECRGTGEGWGDFIGMHLAIRDNANWDGTFSSGIYAEGGLADTGYNGIRRYPYSTNMTKNGLTYGQVVDGVPLWDGLTGWGPNSEVHNAGEVWGSALWDIYAALQKNRGARTFAETKRRMADYIVAGLQATPPDATMVEQRDAFFAAVAASDAADLPLVAAAFAKRGLGSCAVAAPKGAVGNVGVVENFDLKSRLAVSGFSVDDGTSSCDGDNVIDVGETGRVTVQIVNGSVVPSTGVDVTLSSGAVGVIFPAGATVHIDAVPAFGSATASFEVALDSAAVGVQDLKLAITVADDNACQPEVVTDAFVRGNTDELLATSKTDDVEAEATPWTREGGARGWTRQADGALQHRWNGADLGTVSDLRLVSPPLQVNATQPFVVSFKHRHSFEVTPGAAPTYWDGGLIEVSSDDGATWKDVTTLGLIPGYTGTIVAGQNPLQTRPAFVAKSVGYPAYLEVSLDFGTQLAGKTVKLRFRVGNDEAVGDLGWDIDDLGFAGIDNTPFTTVVEDAVKACPTAPVASAGADYSVAIGTLVALDASGSSDVNADSLTYKWTQTAGPTVALSGANGVVAAFTAPVVAVATPLTFQVTVSDGELSASDSATITVLAPTPIVPDAGTPDAGTPDAGSPDAGSPDAGSPDAGSPDAAVPGIDAAVPGIDAALPGTPDAGDTGTGGGGGCDCSVGGEPSQAPIGGALSLLGLAGLFLIRRRRR